MKPTKDQRNTRRMRELRDHQERLIAKGKVSLSEQDEVLHQVIEKNENIKAVVNAVRNKN